MKKLLAIIMTLCTLLSLGGCAGIELHPSRAEREIARQLMYTASAPGEISEVISYDPELYTYYVRLTGGTLLALSPGYIKSVRQYRGNAIRCDADWINRALERHFAAE